MSPAQRAPACPSSLRTPPWAVEGCWGLVCVLVAPRDQASVGFVGYWESPAGSLAAALAMQWSPVELGHWSWIQPQWLCLPPAQLPAWTLALHPLPGQRQGLPSGSALPALPLCCLPTAARAWGFREAVFSFLLPLCRLSVGPRTRWAPHHATPTAPAVLLPAQPAWLPAAFLPSPGAAEPCSGRQQAQKRQEKPRLPF